MHICMYFLFTLEINTNFNELNGYLQEFESNSVWKRFISFITVSSVAYILPLSPISESNIYINIKEQSDI